MAAIWTDQGVTSQVIVDNKTSDLMYKWFYVTFSGEVQAMAQIRWRKADIFSSISDRMNVPDSVWSTPLQVNRLEDRTTWVLSGGQLVPPAEASRRYSEIKHVTFPIGKFSDGVWFFQVRFKNVGSEGGDWSGWATHLVEISEYDDRSIVYGTATTFTKGPSFPNEGTYGMVVQTMSAAGVLSAVSAEQTFDVWETNKYISRGGLIDAIPENWHNGTQSVRVKRT